eukprot:8933920-Pyramimonas_sp.AAC.1
MPSIYERIRFHEAERWHWINCASRAHGTTESTIQGIFCNRHELAVAVNSRAMMDGTLIIAGYWPLCGVTGVGAEAAVRMSSGHYKIVCACRGIPSAQRAIAKLGTYLLGQRG